jgi:hypothetical protein
MCKTNYMYEQIKYRNMTPEAALDHARSVRPRVLLAPSQWQVWSLTFIFCYLDYSGQFSSYCFN